MINEMCPKVSNSFQCLLRNLWNLFYAHFHEFPTFSNPPDTKVLSDLQTLGKVSKFSIFYSELRKVEEEKFAKIKQEEDEEFQVENSQMFQFFKFPGISVLLDLFSRSQVHYEVKEFSRQKTLLAAGENYFMQLSLIIAAL